MTERFDTVSHRQQQIRSLNVVTNLHKKDPQHT